VETQRDGTGDSARVSATPGSSPSVGVLIAVWAAWALVAAPLFWQLSTPGRSDIDAHAGILLDGLATGTTPWYTIWYSLLYVVSLGQATSYEDLRLPAVVILSIAMGAKAAVTLWVLGRTRAPLSVTLLAMLFVLVVVPLRLSFATGFYLGKITPTIWHNPTTVMLMPVSLVLFVVALDVLRGETTRWFATVGLVGILVVNLLMKPNFGLVFLPVFGIYVLTLAVRRRKQAGWWRPLARYSFMAVVGIALLGAQYYGTYASGAVNYANTFDPLAVWREFTAHIPLAATESLLLPLLATIFLWRDARDRTSIVLAWSCTALGLTMFALLSEIDLSTGATLAHGNWSWAMQVAMFVLTVMLVREWLCQRRTLSVGRRTIIACLAALQFLTGLVYLVALALSTYL
jgi:hypothetical protein